MLRNLVSRVLSLLGRKRNLWERVEVTNFLGKLEGSENFGETEFRQITEVLLP